MKSVITAIAASAATAFVLSCGGGGAAGPKPLSHHFDDAFIASVDMDKKQAMLQAQNDYSASKAARMKAEADYSDSATALAVAKNEVKQGVLEEKNAESMLKSAEASGDQNRIMPARRDARVAELARRAADEKVTVRKAERKYFKVNLLYVEEEMYHREARYELAKAKVARDNNISPKNFKFSVYQRQAEERSKRAQRAKALAEREKASAETRRQKWQKAKRAHDSARGAGTEAQQ